MTDNNNTEYNGPQRRHEHRRQTTDRREDIRFEPDKTDRRKNAGRRSSDSDPWSKSTA